MQHIKAIAAYRNEHQCLLEVTARVEKLLKIWTNKVDVSLLKMRVRTFGDGVLLHLIMEDGHFYPMVEAKGNAIINAEIKNIRQDARELAEKIKIFNSQWQEKDIVKNFNLFRKEFLYLAELLVHRTEIEEKIFALMGECDAFDDEIKYFSSGVQNMVQKNETRILRKETVHRKTQGQSIGI